MTAAPHGLVRIRPPRRWESIDSRALWRFRGLIWALAARDITLRYRQTMLGVLWIVLQPLIGAGILSFVFGRVAMLDSAGVPYMLLAYVGLMGWNVFSTTVLKASTSLIGNASLISKVAFPRLVLPLSGVIGTFLDAGIAVIIGFVLVFSTDVRPGLAVLAFPVWMTLLAVLGLGIGLMFGALAVAYRDVTHILPVGLQLLLYASPVGYLAAAVPAGAIRNVFYLNPLAPLLDALRASLVGTPSVGGGSLAYAAVVSLATLLAGVVFFRRRERQFADVI